MCQQALAFAIVVAFTGYGLISWFKEDLQESNELHLAFRDFHEKYAREPTEIMTRAKIIHRNFMLEIEGFLRRYGFCHHLEYIGNSYKGVTVRKSIADDDLEFDVVLVIDKYEYYDLHVLNDISRPGYAWLKIYRGAQPSPELGKVLKYWNIFGHIFRDIFRYIFGYIFTADKVLKFWNIFGYIIDGDLYVDPDKTTDIFFDELQYLIKNSHQMSGRVKFRRHGSAIKMEVYPNSGLLFWGPRLYSVNLVPAYQVGRALYVSKALKEEVPNRMTWRRSFSIQEKHNLSGGPKYVWLTLKAVRNREPALAPLTSYHLKTALLYEMDAECDWSDRALMLRFLGVLGQLETSLDNGNLPDYFIPDINLLVLMSPLNITNASNRIQSIRSSEKELMEILNS